MIQPSPLNSVLKSIDKFHFVYANQTISLCIMGIYFVNIHIYQISWWECGFIKLLWERGKNARNIICNQVIEHERYVFISILFNCFWLIFVIVSWWPYILFGIYAVLRVIDWKMICYLRANDSYSQKSLLSKKS